MSTDYRQYLDCEDFSIDYIQNEVPIRQKVEKIILKEQENFPSGYFQVR